MKKILVFTTTFPSFLEWYVVPSFVYDLSKRLQKLGLQVVVLTPRLIWSKKYEEVEGIKIYRYPYFFVSKWEKLTDWAILPNIKKNRLLLFQVPFLILAWFINLIKIVKKEKINIIHSHWIIPQWFLSVIYKNFFNKDIKILCTSHWSDINWLSWKIWTFIKKYTLRYLDKLTVVSNDLKNKSISLWIDSGKVEVIPMWVDSDLFLPDKYDDNIKKQHNIKGKFLLFVGRLSEDKWIKYLIKSMVWIINKLPNSKLLIIWHWPLENKLKKQVIDLNLEENIIFIWSVDNKDLPRYFSTSDLFIWPSLSEWFWLVFVEAILSWTVVIWTKEWWIVDIIEEWKTWFFVDKVDSIKLQDKILEVIENNNFDRIRSREIIDSKFSWDIVSKKYYKLINNI